MAVSATRHEWQATHHIAWESNEQNLADVAASLIKTLINAQSSGCDLIAFTSIKYYALSRVSG